MSGKNLFFNSTMNKGSSSVLDRLKFRNLVQNNTRRTRKGVSSSSS